MLQPHLRPQENKFPNSRVKQTQATDTLREWRNQIRRGSAKEKKVDCNGATWRLKPKKTTAGGRTFVHRSFGKSLRIPAKTKNIPVSNSTEMRCISMSPVATGKLSRLSSCINGERTAISTINRSTIFGVLRCIISNRSVHGKRRPLELGDCGDYSTKVINRKHSKLNRPENECRRRCSILC